MPDTRGFCCCFMAAVVHFVKPQRASVFGEYMYAELQYIVAILESHMKNRTRVDAISDIYTSLKSQTRIKRSTTGSHRTRVSSNIPTCIPKRAHWQLFLKGSQNKDELFQFISLELLRITADSQYCESCFICAMLLLRVM